MNSKDRFEYACKHIAIDRPPIDYLGHREVDHKLKNHLGLNTEEELLDYLGCDFFYLPSRDISQNEGFMLCYKGTRLEVREKERVCPFGIRWLRGAYDHKFMVDEAIAGPLESISTEQDILKHTWPKASEFDFSILESSCEAHADKVIVGGLWTGIMGDSYRLHGFQNFLLNMMMNPRLIKTLVDKVTDVYLELNDTLFSQLNKKLDVWFFGNDFGSQNGLLFSVEMWCEFFLDNIKQLTSLAHSHGLKVMMHSCGGISKLIPYLIDAGVDILDPIQVTARDMNIESLKKDFGDKIIFHGGIDTQQVLPGSTPDEVRSHVSETLRVLGKDGGYIFAPSQILGPDIPVENIIAAYQRAKCD